MSDGDTRNAATRRDFLRVSAVAGAGLLVRGCSTDRRARPYASKDTGPLDFKFGAGFTNTDRMSFPSGHATTAFAAAAAVTSETRRIWPGHTWLVGPAMYGGASLVGLSRMYHDKQWASDVVLGAAIGTFTGLKVVRYSHAHPNNSLDRAILKDRAAIREMQIPVVAFRIPVSF